MKRTPFHPCLLLVTMLLCGCGTALAAEPVVRGVAGCRTASLRQGFLYQVQVEYDRDVDVPSPVFPETEDFAVRFHGPRKSRSTNISFINGRQTSATVVTTVFSYTLIPQRLGTLTIPPVRVTVDGRERSTRPIPIQVGRPEEYPGIRIDARLSARRCYVGEPIVIDWTWSFDRNIQGYSLDLPVFQIQDFHFPNYQRDVSGGSPNRWLKVNNQQEREIIGRQTDGRVDFHQPFIPLKPGSYRIPASSVTCQIVDENARRRRREPRFGDDLDDFFGGFEDFFGRSRLPMKKITSTGQPLALEVLPLPQAGRPAGFNGIVGACRIEAAASPLEVNVGEPIILTVRLSGPRFPDRMRLPDLAGQKDLAAGFKVSAPEPGVVDRGAKVFQLTLRANSPDVAEIPPLEVPYFDSKAGKYAVARSRAIPLKVSATREVTSQDLQGVPLPGAGTGGSPAAPAAAAEVQASSQGIAHNYDSGAILYRQSGDLLSWLLQPAVAALLLLPMLLWTVLFAAGRVRRNSLANREERRVQRAGAVCLGQLRKLRAGQPDAAARLYDCLQTYFGLHLRMSPGTVSARDLAAAAEGHPELQAETLPALREVLEYCEFNRFSGTDRPLAPEQIRRTVQAVKAWDRSLR